MTTTDNTTSKAMADLDPMESLFKLALGALALRDYYEAQRIGEMYREQIALARRAAQLITLSQVLRDAAKGSFPESVSRLLLDAACAVEPYDVTPSPQVAEGAELPTAGWARKRDNGTGYSVVALVERDAIAASRRAAGGEALVSPDEWAALCRFRECCDDFDSGGHDVDKAMMRRLERIGVVRSTGFGRHEMTDFGNWLHDHKEAPAPASAGQAAPALVEQYDGPWPTVEMTVAGKRMLEKQTSIEHIKKYSAGIANSIYEAMQAASPVGIAAQPAEGAGQAGQVAIPRIPTEAMLNAARDWSVKKYSQGIGNDAAIGCWQAMYDATERAAAPADRQSVLEEVAAWYAKEGYFMDEDDIPAAIRALATHQPSAQDGGEA